jgi:hypothetical protein
MSCWPRSLPYNALPLRLIERCKLDSLAHDRGGEKELQFHFAGRVPLLPVWHEAQLRVVRWGCRRRESRSLPVGGWMRLTRVESGYWSHCGAEPVDIPAALGLNNGVWYGIREGMRDVLVPDENGVQRVYVICEPASLYYGVMTRSAWMPVLIGERIRCCRNSANRSGRLDERP